MLWTFWLLSGLAAVQVLNLVNALRNYRYVLAKYRKTDSACRPYTLLIVPCKGIDCNFRENIRSFYALNYDNYALWFVVEDEADPAYAALRALQAQLASNTPARDVQIHVAGPSQTCGQKIHNLLYCIDRAPADVEVLAFADSDISIQSNWLMRLVWPLRKEKVGVATGYRWFIPVQNNGASAALSAINAKVTQLLGNTRFNQAWGGAMAIRCSLFRQLGIKQIWERAVSDDFALSYAVRRAGYRIVFVPACVVASDNTSTWSGLFEFVRRQFVITRVYAFNTWLVGLAGVLLSVLGFWSPLVLAIWSGGHGQTLSLLGRRFWAWPLWGGVFCTVLAAQFAQALLRQAMAARLMTYRAARLKYAARVDIFGFWAWSPLLLGLILSSAVGRTIVWRGVRYRLVSPTQTLVLGRKEGANDLKSQ